MILGINVSFDRYISIHALVKAKIVISVEKAIESWFDTFMM